MHSVKVRCPCVGWHAAAAGATWAAFTRLCAEQSESITVRGIDAFSGADTQSHSMNTQPRPLGHLQTDTMLIQNKGS